MPKKCNIGRTVMADFNEFARKLRCRFHFGNTESRGMHPFRQKSFYEQTPACFELENYLDLTKFELSNLDLRNNYYNFTKEQQLGLRSLKNMQDIIFSRNATSKSDKGGAIVISKKTHYIKEGLRQLNSIHYTEIQEPNLLLIKNNIQTQSNRMFDNGHLKQRGYKEHEILRNCESALNIERPELLRFKQESDKQIPLVFVTKYHFSLGNINKALRKHYKKLVRNAKCRELFPKPPMVAYSRHRNLKEILTRSVVQYEGLGQEPRCVGSWRIGKRG
ncbi:unnamed protein product [Mytilus edulis]|uniref:Uncharacterized protein n=1 Tax=Mytilus edulis TaxID=6550 RepID=A0A8S3QI72_MYTED|nr:unnamed protein product [Mytilus edulis]